MIKFLDLQKINNQHEKELKQAASDVIDSGWYLNGKYLNTFENEFSSFIGSKHTVGVANGLDALTLSFRALKELNILKSNDKVLVPAHTYIASTLSISENGLIPVPVPVDEYNITTNIETLERYYSKDVKAILVVHLYGEATSMKNILKFAEKHNLKIIEDCAQAHGVIDKSTGLTAGTIGDFGCFSFYPGKTLGGLADAGCVVTDNEEYADMVKILGNYGSHEKYKNKVKGVNSRLSELQSAFLSVKLKHLKEDNLKRTDIADMYNKITNKKIKLPKRMNNHIFHLFVIEVQDRIDFQAYMLNRNIQTLIHYPVAIHEQEAYMFDFNANQEEFTQAKEIAKHIVSIPMSQVLTAEEVEIIVDVINKY